MPQTFVSFTFSLSLEYEHVQELICSRNVHRLNFSDSLDLILKKGYCLFFSLSAWEKNPVKLTNLMPLVSFDTPWKHQKIKDFLIFFSGVSKETIGMKWVNKFPVHSVLIHTYTWTVSFSFFLFTVYILQKQPPEVFYKKRCS